MGPWGRRALVHFVNQVSGSMWSFYTLHVRSSQVSGLPDRSLLIGTLMLMKSFPLPMRGLAWELAPNCYVLYIYFPQSSVSFWKPTGPNLQENLQLFFGYMYPCFCSPAIFYSASLPRFHLPPPCKSLDYFLCHLPKGGRCSSPGSAQRRDQPLL